MSTLNISGATKKFGQVEVIHGIDLSIEDGEFIVFVGPSGCGKSTLLRMIAGLEDISGGTISIGGENMNDVSPSARGIAMVFQSYALYPHMNVYANMAFGLRLAKVPRDEVKVRVHKAAEVLQIESLLDRLPKSLSGGQRQRVAIGRAIVRDPEVFLFDEPLSNLDAALRVQTRIEIARLHKALGATMIYVTHDQVEAMTLADRIVVLNNGHIEQVGTPLELYDHPKNRFVAGFIGSPKMNFLEVEREAKGGSIQVKLADGTLFSVPADVGAGPATLGLRPDHLQITSIEKSDFTAKIEIVEQLGEHVLIYFGLGNETIVGKFGRGDMLAVGKSVGLTFSRERAHWFTE